MRFHLKKSTWPSNDLEGQGQGHSQGQHRIARDISYNFCPHFCPTFVPQTFVKNDQFSATPTLQVIQPVRDFLNTLYNDPETPLGA